MAVPPTKGSTTFESMIAVVDGAEYRMSRNERTSRYDVTKDGAFHFSSFGSADCMLTLQTHVFEAHGHNHNECPDVVWRAESAVLSDREKARAEAEAAAKAAEKKAAEAKQIAAEQAPV